MLSASIRVELKTTRVTDLGPKKKFFCKFLRQIIKDEEPFGTPSMREG